MTYKKENKDMENILNIFYDDITERNLTEDDLSVYQDRVMNYLEIWMLYLIAIYEDMEIEEIVMKAGGAIFNNAAQAWNHDFYFQTLTPSPAEMPEILAEKLEKTFGSVQDFKSEFIKAAATVFGSGWAWLCKDKEENLSIVTTQNADNPMTQGLKPLLVIDVWEHAYYIDYRNRRAAYLEAIWNLIDWEKVSSRL